VSVEFNVPHNVSFLRGVFSANHLITVLITQTYNIQDKHKKPKQPWFSRLLRYSASKLIGSILKSYLICHDICNNLPPDVLPCNTLNAFKKHPKDPSVYIYLCLRSLTDLSPSTSEALHWCVLLLLLNQKDTGSSAQSPRSCFILIVAC